MNPQHTYASISTGRKIVVAFGVLAGLSFLISALVIHSRHADWPARYLYAGTLILAATFIGLRRSMRR